MIAKLDPTPAVRTSNKVPQIGEANLQAQSPFFSKLPPEIRIEIYKLIGQASRHVEKDWDTRTRRARLRRRLASDDDVESNDKNQRNSHLYSPSSCSPESHCPEVPLLLACRRTYLEAVQYIDPQALIFTDLDALAAFLSWPGLARARSRAREISCSWRATMSSNGNLLPAWKAKLWEQCREQLVLLPPLRRLCVCVFVLEAHPPKDTLDELRNLAAGVKEEEMEDEDDQDLKVDVDIIDETREKSACRFMSGRSMAARLFGPRENILGSSKERGY